MAQSTNDSELPIDRSIDKMTSTIDGLKLTLTGKEMRALLERRAQRHLRRADWWKREQARTPEEQTEEEPLLPSQMCENEAERHSWRAEVLKFIRDHVEPTAVYRLGEADLSFGELLPEKPGWVEQEDYEERTRVGFELGRLTRRVSELLPTDFVATDAAGERTLGAESPVHRG